jgi:hypothetical protein
MFSSNKYANYLAIFAAILVSSYVANRIKDSFNNGDDEYELVRNYLLNDSPLYGFNRPKIWIHTKYEVNARRWKSFYSRNTTDLNEPYIHLTIKTIINHCGKDFNICLIDDETFSKLIPSWDVNISTMAEPMKSHFREIGMLQLVYFYGGMVLPNSFVCLKNMKSFYENAVSGNRAFFCESVNNYLNMEKRKKKLAFIPDTIVYGADKNSEHILSLVEYLKKRRVSPHFTNENEFVGNTSEWLLTEGKNGGINIVDGAYIGIKTNDGKPVIIDQLMEEQYLDYNTNIFGIYIPNDDVLRRTKYQWFAVMSGEEILNKSMIISKYLAASIVDSTDEYFASTKVKSVVSI